MLVLLLAALAAKEPPVVVSALQTPQLVQQCRGKDADPAATFCTGYILGIFDGLSLAHQICPSPTRSSNIEVVAAVRRYLRKKGRKSDSAPSFVVRDALRASFPCKTRR
ncbi:Rap1a/Tai family immunity protein [Sphingomonas sp. KR1UV-12]|uniref:Rap1a/Tai family immunity protein n=1 Tax=Sphingomonas aurea TaxID=3063994 RepID=A0ABT9ENC0_9SPHN|nr:Rap1a/Tai family immunity protein [Sphingomonas sp. KR1UV-12]MDP1028454.1 Rap1a/Tai family immunity protein [Sphingomonas sp. KR1UV-12]